MHGHPILYFIPMYIFKTNNNNNNNQWIDGF